MIALSTYKEGSVTMKLINSEPRNSAINIRCNDAERAMIESLRNTIQPRVSASRYILYLCEKEAREKGIITDLKNGLWTIET